MTQDQKNAETCHLFKEQSKLLIDCVDHGKNVLIISELQPDNTVPDFIKKAPSISNRRTG